MGVAVAGRNLLNPHLAVTWGPALLVVVLILPAPAAAYSVTEGGFADGSEIAQLSFDAFTTELVGPSLRMLTNATVQSGSVEIAPAPGYLNSTGQDTSSSDFAAGRLRDGLRISGGTLSLDSGSSLIVLQASNSFGNATRSSVFINGSRMEVQTGSSGWFRTAGQTVPLTGWGVLRVFGSVPAGSSVQVDVLSPGGAPILTNHSIGRPLDLDPVVYPSVLFRVTLTGVNASSTPSVVRVEIGQRFGDTPIGFGGGRTTANTTASPNGDLTQTASRTSFQRGSSNPVLSPSGGTWYAQWIESPQLIQVGSELWMYIAGRSTPTDPLHIGRARSTDGTAWTVDSTPLLNGTAGEWDERGVHNPLVIQNPGGSGFIMYYGSFNSTANWGATGRATSADGITWVKGASNPVMVPTPAAWDSARTDMPAGVRYDAGVWTMWYVSTSYATGPYKVEMGIATSSDGVNWTKYASNPVHQRSTASFEAGDIGLGRALFDGATFYYFYSCNPTVFWQQCLSRSVNGGYSWTKLGTILSAVAGTWEHNVGDAAGIIVNGSVLMIYLGWNSISQAGRADSVPNIASVGGQVDFGNYPPLTLTTASLSATLPSGSYANAFVSSSANGVSWSAWENVTSGSIALTPARRYERWTVDFSGPAGLFRPAFNGFSIGYSSYFARGTFESRAFSYPELISGGAISASPTPTGGSIKLDLSNDNGSSWAPVVGGAFVSLPPASNVLIYQIEFEGGTATAPVVDTVNLTIQRRGLPENVTVRLGPAGSPFYAGTGALAGPINTSLPADQLNAILNQTRMDTPSATSVDVPLVVTSTHFGGVILSAARVIVTLKNPMVSSFLPLTSSLSMPENSTQRFSVAASSPYAPFSITWTVDGLEATAARDQAVFDYAPGFSAAGPHTIGCAVTNGDTTNSFSWAVTVTNVNRPPVLVLSTPPSPFSASHGATVTLGVTVQDLDGDPLVFAWDVDGTGTPGALSSVNLSGFAVGSHTANVTVSDGTATLIHAWRFEATDVAPTAVFEPLADPTLSHAGSVLFSVGATDADGDPLAFSWWIDGSAVSSTESTYNLSHPTTGTHYVEVRVSAAGRTLNHGWNVTATNAAPNVVSRDPTAAISVPFGARPAFNITVEDADGDTLAAQWTVDGLPVTGTADQFTLPSDLAPGDHAIAYAAADPDGASATAQWVVTVRPPATTSPGFLPGPGLMGVAVAMGAAVVLFKFRRRSEPE